MEQEEREEERQNEWENEEEGKQEQKGEKEGDFFTTQPMRHYSCTGTCTLQNLTAILIIGRTGYTQQQSAHQHLENFTTHTLVGLPTCMIACMTIAPCSCTCLSLHQ